MRMMGLFLATLAWGCTQKGHNHATGSAQRTYVLAGATIQPPRDTGWALLTSDSVEATFQRHSANATARISARTFAIERSADDQAFLTGAEARQQEAVTPFLMMSIHFNHTHLHGATCVRYDGIFRDTFAIGLEREFLTTKGYLCRHPTDPLRALQMELTQRSDSSTPLDMEQTLAVAQAFFDRAAFVRDSPAP